MTLSPHHGDVLLDTATRSIRHGLDHQKALVVDSNPHESPLKAQRSSFVTLHLDGKLRGCMGGLKARLPLICDVAEHAFMAAFKDPRFSGVTSEELPRLDVHLSILSPQTPIRFDSEDHLLSLLRPGIDGLVIARDTHRATFLPSVWESLPEPASFLRRLKEKAGISRSNPPTEAWRYTVESVPG